MLCESNMTYIVRFEYGCLNPCYSGICSVRREQKADIRILTRLNPCYSGICSVSPDADPLPEEVVIGLNPCYSGICSVSVVAYNIKRGKCLNPCYSGICSVRNVKVKYDDVEVVLILVIVEYAL